MATVRTPAGTRIYMQSAISAAQAVTGISKASPAVVSYTGTDPVNGDYVALTSLYGMTEFEDALVKVAAVNGAGNTFEAEDQDSTGYSTFVSGNMQVATLGAEILVPKGFSMSGGEQQFAEYTFLWDKVQRKFPTTTSGVQIDLDCIWDPQDPGMIALRQAADTASKRAFRVLFSDGLEMLFFGYVGASGLPSAQDINAVMETKATIVLATKPRFVFP